jgi:hypothetical protein
LWAVSRKRWSLLGGLGGAFIIALSIGLALDPSLFSHYHQMLNEEAVQNRFIPTLSGMIRALFFRKYFLVQFVPLILGMAWTAYYYWANAHSWNWRTHGLALLVVAVLTSPYAWMTDEAVLLPAILQGVLWLREPKLKVRSQLAIVIFVGLDLLLLLIVKAQVAPATGIFFWSSLVWFGWFWYARSFAGSSAVPESEQVRPSEVHPGRLELPR